MPTDTLFRFLSVTIAPATGYPTISWDLREGWSPVSGSVAVYVEYSTDFTTWTRLNPSTPVTSVEYYQDSNSRVLSMMPAGWYRLILVDGSDTYTSPLLSLQTYFQDADTFRTVRSVVSEEYKRLTKYGAGSPGTLLKRKKWGTVCTECTDEITGTVVKRNCTTCYGTGLVGGYNLYGTCYVDLHPGAPHSRRTAGEKGTEEELMIQARILSFPLLETDDVWVATGTNRRYRITRQIVPVVHVFGMPVILQVVLEELPPGAIEFSIPTA